MPIPNVDEANSYEEPSAEEVLAEAQRRRAEARQLKSETVSKLVVWADRCVFWLSKHWLAVLNTLAFLYVGLPVLAPVLMALGLNAPALIIHTIYRPMCHQLPQRSWFLFGPKLAYRLEELMEFAGTAAVPSRWTAAFVGSEGVGYKVALCQRDIAIYGAIGLSGLAYGLSRRYRKVRPLSWWLYIVVGVLPMLVDGGYQLVTNAIPALFPSFPITPHETTPLLRVITGSLFGWATVWLAYPYVQETMEEFQETLHRRFGWE